MAKTIVVATLRRITQTERGLFGMLLIDGHPAALSVELPWRNNEHDLSSIPPNIYKVVRAADRSNAPAFEIKNVPNRTGILIHVGNSVEETKGCILLGMTLGLGGAYLSESVRALQRLELVFGREEWMLDIVEV